MGQLESGQHFDLPNKGQFDVTAIARNSVVEGNAGSVDVAGMRVDDGGHRLHPSYHPQVLSDIRELLGPDFLERPRHGRIYLKNSILLRLKLRPPLVPALLLATCYGKCQASGAAQ